MTPFHLPLSKTASDALKVIAAAENKTPAQWAYVHIAALIRANIHAYHRLLVYHTFEYSKGVLCIDTVPRYTVESGEADIAIELSPETLLALDNSATVVAAVNASAGVPPTWKTGREWLQIYLQDRIVDALDAAAAKQLADNETRVEPVSPP